jgi:DedD protein
MGLLDLFKRDDRGAPAASVAAASGSSGASGEQAELARTRAKRRLIGAVVLLGVGVIAFPLLFETQPRPIPVNIPIEIPSRDNSAPLPLPAAKPGAPKPTASGPVMSEAPRDVAPLPAPVPAAPPVQSAPKVAVAKVEPAPAPKVVVDAPKPEPVKPVTEAPGRFVVQVGAFSEASAVRDARAKVEKLGLATYTQVVDTSSGQRTRVRLGPFATREQADQAAGKVKSAGLPASVLAL